jgi:hypothetical protein
MVRFKFPVCLDKPLKRYTKLTYTTFKSELSATKFASGQDGSMKLHLNLLDSFMKRCEYTYWILANTENDFLDGTLGSLTIVDLTDPVIDADSAGVLFDILLRRVDGLLIPLT